MNKKNFIVWWSDFSNILSESNLHAAKTSFDKSAYNEKYIKIPQQRAK